MIYSTPEATFTAIVEGFDSGLSTVGIKIEDASGDVVLARTEVGITEIEEDSGAYVKTDLLAPGTEGTYILIWDDGNPVLAERQIATEELRVTYSVPAAVVPPKGGISATEAKTASTYLRQRYPDGTEDALQELVNVASALVSSLTGRMIPPAETGEAVPPGMWSMAVRAVTMKAEQLDSVVGTTKARRRSLGRGNLASFSAGSYSESYFGPEQAMRAKRLDADPILSELLWALCTEAKRLEWLGFWDPENFPVGEGGVVAYEYGNRPNYGSWPWGP